MKTIWKYELKIGDAQPIKMPVGADIKSVQVQFGSICLWALVDTAAELETRWIVIHGTGHRIPPVSPYEYKFIGTVQLESGALVFHVFELFIPNP